MTNQLKMKISLLLLVNIVFIFSNCGLQNDARKNYSQKVEYDLQGPVKEVVTYMCKVDQESIPVDTTNFFGRYSVTFDRDGNAIENSKKTKNENGTEIIYKLIYSGKGKEISYEESGSIDSKAIEKARYKYVWLDEHSYKTVKENGEGYSFTVTMDNDFRTIKNEVKQGDFQTSTTFENFVKDNSVTKIIARSTTRNVDTTKTVNVQVMKDFDRHHNPTKIYIYDDLDEKKPTAVVFRYYKYH
jgi:hypothetical protein